MRDSDIQVDSWYIELTFSVGILKSKKWMKRQKSYALIKNTWKQGGEVDPPLAQGCAVPQARFPRMPGPEMEKLVRTLIYLSLITSRIENCFGNLLHNHQIIRIQEFLSLQDISIQVSYTCISTTKTIMHRFRERTSKKPPSPSNTLSYVRKSRGLYYLQKLSFL